MSAFLSSVLMSGYVFSSKSLHCYSPSIQSLTRCLKFALKGLTMLINEMLVLGKPCSGVFRNTMLNRLVNVPSLPKLHIRFKLEAFKGRPAPHCSLILHYAWIECVYIVVSTFQNTSSIGLFFITKPDFLEHSCFLSTASQFSSPSTSSANVRLSAELMLTNVKSKFASCFSCSLWKCWRFGDRWKVLYIYCVDNH